MLPFAYQAFITVVEAGSFYQAAQLLNVTPSAISHSINQLEKKLGFSVLVRNRAGVRLTENGQEILPMIQTILADEQLLEQKAANISGVSQGIVRIGAFSSVCINWLPPILRHFKKHYPQIKIKVTQDAFNNITSDVRSGKIDLGFTCDPKNDAVIKVPLIKDMFYCITPTDFIPINGHSITQADIIDKSFILQHSDYIGDTKAVLDHYNVTVQSLQFSIDDQSIIAMVEAGLGIGILPKLALIKTSGEVNAYPFDKEFYRDIYLIINSIETKAPANAKMVSTIKQFIEKHYPEHLCK
ncbi:transcriptional regulator [Apilactobacillus ozensis DSM 23829 = JCM 17196]|uniref:Transcriptional regulator n=1 Tax=Apilactobacillus ozensis DSM 23829 = JCM 17196 TaxID=1423781 RepID=A0A0R2AYB0_9LACO|nr:LysR family transcriptional regulator [Apilactobacillus ozensis]KRM68179.1 transcriptional regulator [Apilactobacillus ozensis DSM 23829 = JCM 17196]